MSPSADHLYSNLWVWSTCGVVTWIQMGLSAGSPGPRMITYRLPVCICACPKLHRPVAVIVFQTICFWFPRISIVIEILLITSGCLACARRSQPYTSGVRSGLSCRWPLSCAHSRAWIIPDGMFPNLWLGRMLRSCAHASLNGREPSGHAINLLIDVLD